MKMFNNEMLEDCSCGSTKSHTNTNPERMSPSVVVKKFEGDVGVVITCLEEIWSKAVDLLNTKGAVVSTPGEQNCMMVLGKRLHLVETKKGGAFFL